MKLSEVAGLLPALLARSITGAVRSTGFLHAVRYCDLGIGPAMAASAG